MLNVEGETGLPCLCAHEDDVFRSRNGQSKLKPDVRVVEGNLRQTQIGTPYASFYLIDRNRNRRITVDSVGF
jgi:hypothetical protein